METGGGDESGHPGGGGPRERASRILLDAVVGDGWEGGSIHAYLRRREGLSTRLIRRLKREGGIERNGVPARTPDPLLPGDRIRLSLPAPPPPVEPEPAPPGALAIAYEDDALLIVEKAAGLLVHPTPGVHGGTLLHYLLGHRKERGEPLEVHLVQRLDRDTSGLLVAAKDPLAAERLARQLARGRLRRTYLAWVRGWPAFPSGRIDLPLARDEEVPARRVVDWERGQRAVTRYRMLRRRPGAALLLVRLETGRTHQIRAHLAHLGHPLLGDALYGGLPLPGLPGQALHAVGLRLAHPFTGRPLRFRSWPGNSWPSVG